jgi:hypothetical protein
MWYHNEFTNQITEELRQDSGQNITIVDFFNSGDYLQAVSDKRIMPSDVALILSIDGT